MTIKQSIIHGIAGMGIDVPEAAAMRLAHYVALLGRWNRVYNLTAVRRPEDIVARHILESLSILPWVQGYRVLDVGSGAGLPGIPLAMARPDLAFTLLDSNGKRTRFMTQAVAELGLTNVRVVRCRVEEYCPDTLFDSVLSRAFASLAIMLENAGRLCDANGCVLAMKGVRPDSELADVPSGYRLVGVYPLAVPGLNADRHLVHCAPVPEMETVPCAQAGDLLS